MVWILVFGYLICNCINEGRPLLTTTKNIDNNRLDLSEPILIKTLLFGSDSFYANANTNVSMQLLNIFHLLKDLKKRFFNEVKNFSNKVMNQ